MKKHSNTLIAPAFLAPFAPIKQSSHRRAVAQSRRWPTEAVPTTSGDPSTLRPSTASKDSIPTTSHLGSFVISAQRREPPAALAVKHGQRRAIAVVHCPSTSPARKTNERHQGTSELLLPPFTKSGRKTFAASRLGGLGTKLLPGLPRTPWRETSTTGASDATSDRRLVRRRTDSAFVGALLRLPERPAAKDAELLLDFNGGGERGISTVVEMSKPKYGDGATGVAADWMSCSNEAIRNEKCTPDAISLRSGGVYGKFRFLGRLAVDPPTSERKCVGSKFLVSKRLFGTTHPSVCNLCAQLTAV